MKKKLSLKQKAVQANGKSRACKNCGFMLNKTLSISICNKCREEFIAGYIKGYNTHKREQ